MTAQTVKIGDATLRISKADHDPEMVWFEIESQKAAPAVLSMTKAQASTLGDILKLLGK